MSYLAELDNRPLEVRRGYAGNVLPWWPKVPGVGNVLLATTPTYSLFAPDGTVIASGLNATVTPLGTPNVSRVDITVDASNTDTWELGRHYRFEVTWVYGGVERVHSDRFDCALEPYTPAISLNDFLDEEADAQQFLEGQAQTIEATTPRTAEEHASVLGVKAWCDVYRWLEQRAAADGQIIPRLIIERRKIEEVVIAQALFRMFRGEGGREGSESNDRAEAWKAEAAERYAALGELSYDSNEDHVPDETLRSPVEQRLVRRW